MEIISQNGINENRQAPNALSVETGCFSLSCKLSSLSRKRRQTAPPHCSRFLDNQKWYLRWPMIGGGQPPMTRLLFSGGSLCELTVSTFLLLLSFLPSCPNMSTHTRSKTPSRQIASHCTPFSPGYIFKVLKSKLVQSFCPQSNQIKPTRSLCVFVCWQKCCDNEVFKHFSLFDRLDADCEH